MKTHIKHLKGHLATLWLDADRKAKSLRSARSMRRKASNECERRVFAHETERLTRQYKSMRHSIKETRLAIKAEEIFLKE